MLKPKPFSEIIKKKKRYVYSDAGRDWGQEEKDDRGWDGWMASLTQWTWVWVNSGSWWWTGKPGVLRFMGSQRVRHDWVTELNWTEVIGCDYWYLEFITALSEEDTEKGEKKYRKRDLARTSASSHSTVCLRPMPWLLESIWWEEKVMCRQHMMQSGFDTKEGGPHCQDTGLLAEEVVRKRYGRSGNAFLFT